MFFPSKYDEFKKLFRDVSQQFETVSTTSFFNSMENAIKEWFIVNIVN